VCEGLSISLRSNRGLRNGTDLITVWHKFYGPGLYLFLGHIGAGGGILRVNNQQRQEACLEYALAAAF
jgi:hypothetical protein